MALLNRSTRKIIVKLIGVGIVVIFIIILIETFERDHETVQGSGGEVEFLHRMTWITPPNKERVDKAKALSYKGRHRKYFSEALVDLFGFSSECHLRDADDMKKGLRSTSVIILLHSSPWRVALRDKIRETWANPEECRRHGVLVRFVMGGPASQDEVELLKEESAKHGDVLVGNFTDTVRATTMKSLLGLRWTLAFCSRIDYVIEASDKTFMWLDKLPKLLRTFKKEKNSKFILGDRSNSSRVVQRNFMKTDVHC